MPADWRFMYGDQCQFMRRTTFEAIGGFPEIPLMEDVEMSRALNRTGRVVRINLRAVTSSRRLLEKGILRQTLENFWRMVRYLYLKTTPEALAATYRSSREEAE
jgi:GT2 family glycosyltransferase